ncbi:hypothetical protein NQ176_g3774 [Zarea fungicola]|uniref:Uncharacterized protein n=1 Tax=Zarea fungicola TaxID=93591 RepID=A0ACC1NHV0_9HYPO|nr:hypothetical protein NQ176_g3774 [Lecanicillium fungicola]
MLRQVKPRNARSKRAMAARESKPVENPRTCLMLRGGNCSQIVQDALVDFHAMHQPRVKKFTKKNPIHPFEDASSLEFFSEKNDASLLLFGSSQKKRPHALTFIRTFGYKVLDMLELHLDPETFRAMALFKNKKFSIGLRPMLLFAGTAFESPVANEYTLAKSILTDFFKGEPSDKIDVEGLQYIVSFTAEEESGAAAPTGTNTAASGSAASGSNSAAASKTGTASHESSGASTSASGPGPSSSAGSKPDGNVAAQVAKSNGAAATGLSLGLIGAAAIALVL